MLMVSSTTLQMTRSSAAARDRSCTPRLNPLQNLGARTRQAAGSFANKAQLSITGNGSSLISTEKHPAMHWLRLSGVMCTKQKRLKLARASSDVADQPFARLDKDSPYTQQSQRLQANGADIGSGDVVQQTRPKV